MKDDTLDQLIKDQLEHLSAPRPKDAWAAFEQQLDAQESGVPQPDETVIDQIVFDKLHQYEAVRPNSGWHLLRHRMNTRTAITYRIASWKTVEAVVLSLLLLLLTRLPLPIAPTSPIADELSGQAAGEAENTPEYNPTMIPVPPVRPGIPPADKATSTAVPDTDRKENRATTTPAIPSRPAMLLPSLPAKSQQEVLSVLATRADIVPPVITQQVTSSQDTGMPPFIDPKRSSLTLHEAGNAALANLIQSVPRAHLNVGMYGDIAYNRIITPPDLDNEITGFDRYALGYGGGFLLGLKKGAFEVGSGMAYHAIRYEPIPLLVTRGFFNQGYTTEKFDFVELNVLSVPLYLQYDLLNNSQWRFYTTTGAALNVAYETNFYAVFPEDLGLPNGLRPTPRRQSTIGNRFGWFEGGSFRKNSYFTLNLGFGLERTFAERWSMFLQPTYLHNLGYYSDGMGPTHDRIHTMSILTGIRVKVKR